MSEVSIIVRTKNEERWISHCLSALFSQEYKDFEVILVDNESEDHTVEVVKRFPISNIVTIHDYKPGKALNEGIRVSNGKYIACLSAHCVPRDKHWLSNLLRNIEDTRVAGVYGRQLPVAFSDAIDKRDLLIVFGLDRRVQEKDYFFHNANSMIRRDLWEITPFNEEVTNIEDRVWGKAMISAGYHLVYEPDAAVYHHHGLHQGNDERRANGVVSIIEEVDNESVGQIPDSLKPEQCNVAAFVPVLGPVRKINEECLLSNLLDELLAAKYVSNIYVFSENEEARKISTNKGVKFITRPPEMKTTEKSIEDVLQYGLELIESDKDYPEAILYTNYLYPFRPFHLFDELIRDAQYRGLDTVFPGYLDYTNYWQKIDSGEFKQVNSSLMPRDHKQPLYRALYGLGCLTSVPIIRNGKLVGGKIGILPIDDYISTLRYTDEHSKRLLSMLFREMVA